MRRFRCVLCLGCPLKAGNSTLHRCGTIPAPLQARQSCRFLETNLLFPPLAALRRFPLRAKSFLPEGELPRSGQEKPLWRAHMSRRKTDLNLFRAVRGTWAAVGSFAALRMRRTPCGCFARATSLSQGRLPSQSRLTPCQLPHRGSQGGQKACHCEADSPCQGEMSRRDKRDREAQRADVAIRNPPSLGPLVKEGCQRS